MIVGIDPSLRKSGLAIYDGKEIRVMCIVGNSECRSYEGIINATYDDVNRIIKSVEPNSQVYTEVPPPNARFSAGLYGLGVHMIIELLSRGCTVRGVSSTFINHLHGTRNTTKTDNIKLAQKIIDFLTGVVSIKVDGKLTDDKADAFLILCRGLQKNGVVDIHELVPNIVDEKEFSLSLKEEK